MLFRSAEQLVSSSLNEEGMEKWLQGGSVIREAAPLGYAGNPAGHRAVAKHVAEMLDMQVENIVSQMRL